MGKIVIILSLNFLFISNIYSWTLDTVESTGKGGELKISWTAPSGDYEGDTVTANDFDIWITTDTALEAKYGGNTDSSPYYKTGLNNWKNYYIYVKAWYWDGNLFHFIAQSETATGTPYDTTAPYAPGMPVHSDSDSGGDGIGPEGGYDDDTLLYFSWTASSGDTNTDPNGSWNYEAEYSTDSGTYGKTTDTTNTNITITGEAGHNYRLRVRTEDDSGNTSNWQYSNTIFIDTSTPAKPVIVQPLTPASTNPITITGTAEANSTVCVYNNSSLVGTASASIIDGSFSREITLSDGDNAITAKAADKAGNVSEASDGKTVFWNTPPTLTITQTSEYFEPGSTVTIRFNIENPFNTAYSTTDVSFELAVRDIDENKNYHIFPSTTDGEPIIYSVGNDREFSWTLKPELCVEHKLEITIKIEDDGEATDEKVIITTVTFIPESTLSFLWPLSSTHTTVSSVFGEPRSNVNRFHEGIDISASGGTPVKIAEKGWVEGLVTIYDGTKKFIIDYGNNRGGWYIHVDTNNLTKGRLFRKGEVFTNVSDIKGSHLHYSFYKDNVWYNPLKGELFNYIVDVSSPPDNDADSFDPYFVSPTLTVGTGTIIGMYDDAGSKLQEIEIPFTKNGSTYTGTVTPTVWGKMKIRAIAKDRYKQWGYKGLDSISYYVDGVEKYKIEFKKIHEDDRKETSEKAKIIYGALSSGATHCYNLWIDTPSAFNSNTDLIYTPSGEPETGIWDVRGSTGIREIKIVAKDNRNNEAIASFYVNAGLLGDTTYFIPNPDPITNRPRVEGGIGSPDNRIEINYRLTVDVDNVTATVYYRKEQDSEREWLEALSGETTKGTQHQILWEYEKDSYFNKNTKMKVSTDMTGYYDVKLIAIDRDNRKEIVWLTGAQIGTPTRGDITINNPSAPKTGDYVDVQSFSLPDSHIDPSSPTVTDVTYGDNDSRIDAGEKVNILTAVKHNGTYTDNVFDGELEAEFATVTGDYVNIPQPYDYYVTTETGSRYIQPGEIAVGECGFLAEIKPDLPKGTTLEFNLYFYDWFYTTFRSRVSFISDVDIRLEYSTHSIKDDDFGNADSAIEAGEFVKLPVKIINNGYSYSDDVIGTIDIDSEYSGRFKRIYNGTVEYGDIGSKSDITPYNGAISTDNLTSDYHFLMKSDAAVGDIPVTLTLTDEYGSDYISTFTIKVTGKDSIPPYIAVVEISSYPSAEILTEGATVQLCSYVIEGSTAIDRKWSIIKSTWGWSEKLEYTLSSSGWEGFYEVFYDSWVVCLGLKDGTYKITELEVDDNYGNIASTSINKTVEIDTEEPVAGIDNISIPGNQKWVTITGTAWDVHFASYTLYWSTGLNVPVDSQKWIYIEGSESSIAKEGEALYTWDIESLTGEEYSIKIRAWDNVGHRSEATANLVIDNNPPIVNFNNLTINPGNHPSPEVFTLSDNTVDIVLELFDTYSTSVTVYANFIVDTATISYSYNSFSINPGTTTEIIYSWNGNDEGGNPAPDGIYTILIWAVDSSGNRSTATISLSDAFEVDRTPAYFNSIYVDKHLFIPENGEKITLTYILSDTATINISVIDINGTIILSSSEGLKFPDIEQVFVWDGSGVEDGSYLIKVESTDDVENKTSQSINIIRNQIPARITFPQNYEVVGGTVIISGIALDPILNDMTDFYRYELWFAQGENLTPVDVLAPSTNTWQGIPVPVSQQIKTDEIYPHSNKSYKAILNGDLGYLDTTSLTPGATYTIFLVSKDTGSTCVSSLRNIVIDPSLEILSAPILNIESPQQGESFTIITTTDTLEITYSLSQRPADVIVEIFREESGEITDLVYRTFYSNQTSGRTIYWDGKDYRKWYVDDGNYKIRIEARDIDGLGISVKEVDISVSVILTKPLKIEKFYCVPEQIQPSQNTEITFNLSKPATVDIGIYKPDGAFVESLISGVSYSELTDNTTTWSMSQPGVYICKIDATATDLEGTRDSASISIAVTEGTISADALGGISTPLEGSTIRGKSNYTWKASAKGEYWPAQEYSCEVEIFAKQNITQNDWSSPGSYESASENLVIGNTVSLTPVFKKFGYGHWTGINRKGLWLSKWINWEDEADPTTLVLQNVSEDTVRSTHINAVSEYSAQIKFQVYKSGWWGFWYAWELSVEVWGRVKARGEMVSKSFYLGPDAFFDSETKLLWDADEIGNSVDKADIKFQIASSDDGINWTDFLGPDGDINTFYENSDETIWPGHSGKEYIKWKAYFYAPGEGTSVDLKSVTIQAKWKPEVSRVDMFQNLEAGMFEDVSLEDTLILRRDQIEDTYTCLKSFYFSEKVVNKRYQYKDDYHTTRTITWADRALPSSLYLDNLWIDHTVGYPSIYGEPWETGCTIRWLTETHGSFEKWRYSKVSGNIYGKKIYNYYPLGIYTSTSCYLGKALPNGSKIYWITSIPKGTELKFQLASSDDGVSWSDFLGPDGGSGYYYRTDNNIWPGHSGKKYLRWKAYFTSSDQKRTPKIYDIFIVNRNNIILKSTDTTKWEEDISAHYNYSKYSKTLNELFPIPAGTSIEYTYPQFLVNGTLSLPVAAYSIDGSTTHQYVRVNIENGKIKAETTGEEVMPWNMLVDDTNLGGERITGINYEFNNSTNPLNFILESSPVQISSEYPIPDMSAIPEIKNKYTFWMDTATGQIIDNPYVYVDASKPGNWDIDLYNLDGSSNTDLAVDYIREKISNTNNFTSGEADDDFKVLISTTGEITPKEFIIITGTASSSNNFIGYALFYQSIKDTNTWKSIPVLQADTPIENDILAYWDVTGLNGEYKIRLLVLDESGTLEFERNITIGTEIQTTGNGKTYINAPFNKAYLEFSTNTLTLPETATITPMKLSDTNIGIGENTPLPLGAIFKMQPPELNDKLAKKEDGSLLNPPWLTVRLLPEEIAGIQKEQLSVYYVNNDGMIKPTSVTYVDTTTWAWTEVSCIMTGFSEYMVIPAIVPPELDPVVSYSSYTPILITGKAEANTTVEIYINGASVGIIAVDGSGSFSTNLPLTEGNNYIQATTTRWLETGKQVSEKSSPILVVLDTEIPRITNLADAPDPFSPDGDGVDDITSISYTNSEDVYIEVKLIDSAENQVRIIYDTTTTMQPGNNITQWDGNNDETFAVPNGSYTYKIRAIDLALNSSKVLTGLIFVNSSDIIPPATVLDFQAINSDSSTITLSWSAPGNDGTVGSITEGRYQICYATFPVEDFKECYILTWATDTLAGNIETKIVADLSPSTTYFFRIRTADNADNVSEWSNYIADHTCHVVKSSDSVVMFIYKEASQNGVDLWDSVYIDTISISSQQYTDAVSAALENDYLIVSSNFYKIKPSSINFSDTAALYFKYINEEIPYRIEEDDLLVCRYDSESGWQWMAKLDQDFDNNFIIAEIYSDGIYGILASKNLMVKNISVDPVIFSPNGDDRKDITTISADLSRPASWTVTIWDLNDTVVDTIDGSGSGVDGIYAVWSPTGIVEGIYTFEIEAKYGDNKKAIGYRNEFLTFPETIWKRGGGSGLASGYSVDVIEPGWLDLTAKAAQSNQYGTIYAVTYEPLDLSTEIDFWVRMKVPTDQNGESGNDFWNEFYLLPYDLSGSTTQPHDYSDWLRIAARVDADSNDPSNPEHFGVHWMVQRRVAGGGVGTIYTSYDDRNNPEHNFPSNMLEAEWHVKIDDTGHIYVWLTDNDGTSILVEDGVYSIHFSSAYMYAAFKTNVTREYTSSYDYIEVSRGLKGRITVDLTNPESCIYIPEHNKYYNNISEFSGIAYDNIQMEKVEIQLLNENNGFYWNASNSSWTVDPSWNLADLTGTTWTITGPPLISGTTYTLYSKAEDSGGNFEILGSTGSINSHTFIFDNEPPVSIIHVPEQGSVLGNLTEITGTSFDSVSGVTKVELEIYNLDEKLWWNGSVWISLQSKVLCDGTTNWKYSIPNSSITFGGDYEYQIKAYAEDTAGNEETPVTRTFFLDMQPPVSVIQFPEESSNYISSIDGTSFDQRGIDHVNVSIFDQTVSLYWDGVSWISTQTWLTATGTSTWTYEFTDWIDGHYYFIQSQAYDIYGNIEVIGPEDGNTIKYDISAPCGISDLRAESGPLLDTISLKWTAPGDDGTVGQAVIYELKYADSQIKGTDWYSSGVSTYIPAYFWTPGNPGSVEDYRNLDSSYFTPGNLYYFALRAYDEAGNFNVWYSSIEVAGINPQNYAEPLSLPPSTPDMIMTYFSSSTVNEYQQYPYCRYEDGMQWTAGYWIKSITNTASGWYIIKKAPHRDEWLLGIRDKEGHITLQVYDGINRQWGNLIKIATYNSYKERRTFDIAYEQESGIGVVVFKGDGVQEVNCIRWDGASWSEVYQIDLSTYGAGTVNWIKLASRAHTDRLILGISDSSSDLTFHILDGTTPVSGSGLFACASLQSALRPSFDVAWEQLSGRGMGVWANDKGEVYYAIYSDSVWQTYEIGKPGTIDLGHWLTLKPKPWANDMLMGMLDNRGADIVRIHVFAWNGNVWDSGEILYASLPDANKRYFDLSWESYSGNGMAVYSTVQDAPAYRRYINGIWEAEQYAASTGLNKPIEWVVARQNGSANTNDIMLMFSDAGNNLHVQKWDGFSWSSNKLINDNTPCNFESFAMASVFSIAPPDYPPMCQLISPSTGYWYKELISINGTSSDDNEVAYVYIYYTTDDSTATASWVHISTITEFLDNWAIIWDSNGIGTDDKVWIKVRAEDSVGQYSPWIYRNIKIDNEPPNGLANKSPVDGTYDVELSTKLVSESATDVGVGNIVYLFEIDKSSSFNTISYSSSSWITVPFWSVELSYNTTYYWRVRTKDELGNATSPTFPWRFITEKGIPRNPDSLMQLWADEQTPIAQKEWISTTTVCFKFTMAHTAENVNLTPCVELAPVTNALTNFENYTGPAVTYSGTAVTGTIIVEGLTSETTYHWQARVKDEYNNYSDWVVFSTASFDFGMDINPPINVALDFPANNAVNVSTVSILTVVSARDNGIGDIRYLIELDTDSLFNSESYSSSTWQSELTWQPELTLATTYYWRVQAKDGLNNASLFCGHNPDIEGYGRFVTEIVAPEEPYNLQQLWADNVTPIPIVTWISTTTVLFRFSMFSLNPSDVLTPQVEVKQVDASFDDTETQSGDEIHYTGTPVIGTVMVTSLKTGNVYHWQARVKGKNGQYSPWVSFSTASFDFGCDVISPIGITDFSAEIGVTEGKVELTWTSPGDDGTSGNLSGKFRIDYATYTKAWSCTDYQIELSTTDCKPLTKFSYTITGLIPGTTYYFALWTGDRVPNWSDISNISQAMAQYDVTPPSTITDLVAVTGKIPYSINLTWTSPGDDGLEGKAYGYIVKYATFSITEENWNGATIYAQSWSPLASGSQESFLLKDLAPGVTYYIAVKTEDERGNISLISNISVAESRRAYLLISEVCVGTDGADNEFVEIYNPTDSDITIDTDTFKLRLVDSDDSITTKQLIWVNHIVPSKGFFLFGAGTISPAPDATFSPQLTNTSGVIISDGDGNIIDRVSWGSPPPFNAVEGTGVNSTLSTGDSIERKTNVQSTVSSMANGADQYKGNGYDTNDNADNFVVHTGFYNPQNSSNDCEPDLITPAPITDLTASTGTEEGEITLIWTAPGDEGTIGNNTWGAYILKYSTTGAISDITSWISANEYSQDWIVKNRGTTENHTIMGLVPGVTYWWAIKSIDEGGNISEIDSSTPRAKAIALIDVIPPSAITDLVSTPGDSKGEIDLTWTSPGDDGLDGTATAYIIRYSTIGEIDTDAKFSDALEYANTWIPQSAGNKENFTLTGLKPGVTYWWSIKSKDNAGNLSEISNSPSAQAQTGYLSVVINEIAWMGTAASYYDEWIELYNNTSSTISLTNWTLSGADGTPNITLSGSIGPYSYFLLERSDDNTVSDITADQIYTGALDNTGEDLSIKDSSGDLIDRVDCSDGWFAGDNTSKISMERKDPTAGGSTSTNWNNNDGITTNGLDANGDLLTATPKARNSRYGTATPLGIILSPEDRAMVNIEELSVIGYAYTSGGTTLKEWHLEWGQGENPQSWQMIKKSTIPVIDNNILAMWNIPSSTQTNVFTLRLTVTDEKMDQCIHQIIIIHDDPELAGVLEGLKKPEDVVVDRRLNIEAVDRHDGVLAKYNPREDLLWSLKDGLGLKKPEGIAVDSEENIYIADTMNHKILKLSPTGQILLSIGSKEEFKKPVDIVIDRIGNIYVSDSLNSRVMILTSTGGFISQIEISKGNIPGQPMGLALDLDNNLYVSDYKNDRVVIYDNQGFIIKKIEDNLNHPRDVAIDGRGNVYISDRHNFSVKKYDLFGNLMMNIELQSITQEKKYLQPAGIALDAEGTYLYVCVPQINQILKIAVRKPTGPPPKEAGIKMFSVGNIVQPIETFRLKEVYSYPNPAKKVNPTIHVDCGVSDAKVVLRIYTITAETVFEKDISEFYNAIKNAYEYIWNTSGKASGVYIYLIRATRNGKTLKKTGKIGLIK